MPKKPEDYSKLAKQDAGAPVKIKSEIYNEPEKESLGEGFGDFTGRSGNPAKISDGMSVGAYTPRQDEYEAKTYDSVGSAGSGFVNLSHLLGLNKESGRASADDMAKRMAKQGQEAESAINSAEEDYWKQNYAGSDYGNLDSEFDVAGDQDANQARIDKAKGAKYSGPADMSSGSAYSDLAKKVAQAEGSAQNAAKGGSGLAAEIGKKTGLSAAQSAASGFFMGANNGAVKAAGSAFSNLSKTLADANARSLGASQFSKQQATRANNIGGQWQRQQDAWNNPDNQIDAINDREAQREFTDLMSRDDFDIFGQQGGDPRGTSAMTPEEQKSNADAYNYWQEWKNSGGTTYEEWVEFRRTHPNASWDAWVANGKKHRYQAPSYGPGSQGNGKDDF